MRDPDGCPYCGNDQLEIIPDGYRCGRCGGEVYETGGCYDPDRLAELEELDR